MSEEQRRERERTVSVSGRGEVEIAPTMGRVTLGVSVLQRMADDSLDQAARLVEQIKAAIVDLGVDSDDISTSWFTIRAEYDIARGSRSSYPVGFRTNYTVRVNVRAIERTGDVVGVAVSAGANTIDHVGFVAESYDEAMVRARELAFEDARQKAEQLADLAGARLGKVLAVNDHSTPPRRGYAPMSREMMYAAAPEMAAPSFDPDDLTISSSLSVVWALEG